MFSRALLCVVVFFGMTSNAQTQEQQAISLLDAYQLARQNATDLAIARYRVDSAEAEKDVALGQILPSVRLFGQWSKNKVDFDLGSMSRIEDYRGERYGVQVAQPLIDVSAGQEVRRFNQIYRQSQEEFYVTESKLLAQVVEAFFNVLLAETQLTQLQSELSALEGQLEETAALHARKLVPVMEVLETQTRTDSVRADVIRASGDLAISKEALIKLTGARGAELQRVQDHISLISAFSSPDEVAILAIQTNPEITAAQAAVEAAKLGVDRERGRWIPRVELTYSYQFSDVGFDNLASPPRDSTTVAVGFNYPLFEGGSGAARLKGAWAEYYAAKTQLEATRLDLEVRARSSWLNLKALTEHLGASKQAVKSSEVNVDAVTKATKVGTAKPSEVLIALAQNTRANLEASAAKFQFAAGWLEVELAAGNDPEALAKQLSLAIHGW